MILYPETMYYFIEMNLQQKSCNSIKKCMSYKDCKSALYFGIKRRVPYIMASAANTSEEGRVTTVDDKETNLI